MFTVIMPILGIVFTVFSIYVFIRDFLIKHVLSDNGFKNVIFAVIIIMVLGCGLLTFGSGHQVKSIQEVLKTETFSEHDKAMMELTLKEQVEKGKEAAVVGSIGIITILFIEKNFTKEKNNNNFNKKRWDLNKVDKD